MPSIPQYNAKSNVQSRAIAPQENLAKQDAVNQNKVIGALQKTAQAWSDAHDTMQYAKAKSDYEIKAAEIKSRADLDENFNNTSKYLDELEHAKNESIHGISNQMVARKASQEIGLSNSINGIKIDSGFKQKELANNQYNVKQWVTSKVNELGYTGGAERMQIQADIEEYLAIQVGQGILSPQMAAKTLQDSKIASATASIFSDPEHAIKELKDKDGAYSDIPNEKKAELITKANDYKKRLKLEATELQKEIIYKNETQIAMDMSEGKPVDIGRLSSMLESGTISSDFAQIALRVVTSPDAVGALTRNQEFNDLTRQVFASKDKEQVQKAINSILKGGGDGKISKDDLEVLLQSAVKNTQATRDENKAAIDALGKWADENKSMDRTEAFRTFQNSIKEGKDAQEAVKEAMTKEQIRVNPARTQYAIGDIVDTSRGPMYVWGYYEDGEPDVRFEKNKK